MDIKQTLSKEFNLKLEYATNIVNLIEEGNTIPFIARYRKEMHGGCNDEVLRDFSDRLTYLKNLETRKEEVRSSIEGQGKWTDELALALTNATTMTEVEDIYRPYKQKKKTRASVAIERGLEPLADIIFAQELTETDFATLAAPFVGEDKGVARGRWPADGRDAGVCRPCFVHRQLPFGCAVADVCRRAPGEGRRALQGWRQRVLRL